MQVILKEKKKNFLNKKKYFLNFFYLNKLSIKKYYIKKKKNKLREDIKKGVYVEGVTE